MEKKNTKLLLLVIGFVLVLFGAYALYNRLSAQIQPQTMVTMPQETATSATSPEESGATTEETEAETSIAPDFTVYDLDGNAHKLSDFRGKPVILNFWASWCGPCVSEMPEFQSFYEEYGQDIHFVLVNLTDGYQETVESASGFVAEQGYTFPVYYDTDIDAAMVYGVNAVPVSYFIDSEGYFVAWAQGALSASMLQQGVDMLLGTE